MMCYAGRLYRSPSREGLKHSLNSFQLEMLADSVKRQKISRHGG